MTMFLKNACGEMDFGDIWWSFNATKAFLWAFCHDFWTQHAALLHGDHNSWWTVCPYIFFVANNSKASAIDHHDSLCLCSRTYNGTDTFQALCLQLKGYSTRTHTHRYSQRQKCDALFSWVRCGKSAFVFSFFSIYPCPTVWETAVKSKKVIPGLGEGRFKD